MVRRTSCLPSTLQLPLVPSVWDTTYCLNLLSEFLLQTLLRPLFQANTQNPRISQLEYPRTTKMQNQKAFPSPVYPFQMYNNLEYFLLPKN